ncbi:MAG: Hsp20/alpha crystallin family protein [Chloroflexota bacterium]
MAQSQFPMTRGTAGMPSTFGNWNEFMHRFMFPSFFERNLSMGTIAPVDVCECGNDFVLRMACPGCTAQDIDVTVEDDVVRIRGKFPSFDHTEEAGKQAHQQNQPAQQHGQQSSTPHEQCLIRELPTGRFERDVTLPTSINAQQAHAKFENGLLTLTLPKTQAAQGHKIQIGQGQGVGAGT